MTDTYFCTRIDSGIPMRSRGFTNWWDYSQYLFKNMQISEERVLTDHDFIKCSASDFLILVHDGENYSSIQSIKLAWTTRRWSVRWRNWRVTLRECSIATRSRLTRSAGASWSGSIARLSPISPSPRCTTLRKPWNSNSAKLSRKSPK